MATGTQAQAAALPDSVTLLISVFIPFILQMCLTISSALDAARTSDRKIRWMTKGKSIWKVRDREILTPALAHTRTYSAKSHIEVAQQNYGFEKWWWIPLLGICCLQMLFNIDFLLFFASNPKGICSSPNIDTFNQFLFVPVVYCRGSHLGNFWSCQASSNQKVCILMTICLVSLVVGLRTTSKAFRYSKNVLRDSTSYALLLVLCG